VQGTRIETESLAAFSARGFRPEVIRRLYPVLDPAEVQEALDLEGQLDRNLGRVALAA